MGCASAEMRWIDSKDLVRMKCCKIVCDAHCCMNKCLVKAHPVPNNVLLLVRSGMRKEVQTKRTPTKQRVFTSD